MAKVWILYASSNDGHGRRYVIGVYNAKPYKKEREKMFRDLDKHGLNGSYVSIKLTQRKENDAKSNAKRGTKKSRR